MVRTLTQILPLAAVATISPTGLLFVTMILSGKGNARRNALLFLIGGAGFLMLLGGVILFVFKPAAEAAGQPGKASAVVDILMGAVIVVIVARSLMSGKKHKKKRERLHIPYLPLGFVYMITNASTLIPFMAASKVLAEDGLSSWENLILFALVLVIAMLLIAFPVIVSYAAPRKSRRILDPVEAFMASQGTRVAQVCFLAIGVYLIIKGARGLTFA